MITAVWKENRKAYGSPRVYRELKRQGERCSVNTIAKYMRRMDIRAKQARKFRPTTTDSKHKLPVAPNVLNRDFKASRPNEKWLADITYIPTGEGWLYVAAIEDLFSRRIVGWSAKSHMRKELVTSAVAKALLRRTPAREMIMHSDRGSQYASASHQAILDRIGAVCSMSRKANCYDNAPMESFFGTLKKELVHHERYATRAEAKRSIGEYIERFYNARRLHSAIGYESPVAFEAAYARERNNEASTDPDGGLPLARSG